MVEEEELEVELRMKVGAAKVGSQLAETTSQRGAAVEVTIVAFLML